MSRNSGHIGKNQGEKQFYSEFIRSQNYTPTVDDSLKFEQTTDDNNEYAVEKNRKRRKRPIGEVISEKWEEYWFQIVTGIGALVFGFFMVDAKVGIAQLFERTENINSNINEVKSLIKDNKQDIDNSIEKIEDKNHEQDLIIRENEVNIQNQAKRDGK